METQPKGRSMQELQAILAADNARFDRIAEVWSELTDDEQEELAHRAEVAWKRGQRD